MSQAIFIQELTKLCTDASYRNNVKNRTVALPEAALTPKELDCLEACGQECGHVPPPGVAVVTPAIQSFRNALVALVTDEYPAGVTGYRNKVLNGTNELKNDFGVNSTQEIVLEEAGRRAGHPVDA
jgi:hypothetical protein